jgi:hypothetical protein
VTTKRTILPAPATPTILLKTNKIRHLPYKMFSELFFVRITKGVSHQQDAEKKKTFVMSANKFCQHLVKFRYSGTTTGHQNLLTKE